MTFDFQLHEPPCDISFLAVINGPVLYNADDAASEGIKEATIRHMAWHALRLPEEWFLSARSRELTERVCRSLQCTIQYLAHRQRKLEADAATAEAKFRKVCEERDEIFEELVELRERLALTKQRYEANTHGGRRTWKIDAAHSIPPRVGKTGCDFICSLCRNCYPSSSSLESHVMKRHHRGKHYAAMTAASSAVHNNIMTEGLNTTNSIMANELVSLRAEVMALRERITVEQEKRETEARSPFFSPINVMALPAHHLPGIVNNNTMGPMYPQVKQSLQEQQKGKEVDILQEELKETKIRLRNMEEALYHQRKNEEGKEGRAVVINSGMHNGDADTISPPPPPPLEKEEDEPPCQAYPKNIAFNSIGVNDRHPATPAPVFGSSPASLHTYPCRSSNMQGMVKTKDFIKAEIAPVPVKPADLSTSYKVRKLSQKKSSCTPSVSQSSSSSSQPHQSLSAPFASGHGSDSQLASFLELEPERSESPQHHVKQKTATSTATAADERKPVATDLEHAKRPFPVGTSTSSFVAPGSNLDGSFASVLHSFSLLDGSVHGFCAFQGSVTSEHANSAANQVQEKKQKINRVKRDEEDVSDKDEVDVNSKEGEVSMRLLSSPGKSFVGSVRNLKSNTDTVQNESTGNIMYSFLGSLQSFVPNSCSLAVQREGSSFVTDSYQSYAEKMISSPAEFPIHEAHKKEEALLDENQGAPNPSIVTMSDVYSEKSKKRKKSFISKFFMKRKS